MAKKDNPFDVPDMSKMFAEMKLPGVDWQAVMASQQKNISALAEANQRLFQGAQVVMQHQAEILQKAMTELTVASQEMMQEGDAKASAEKRFNLAKSSFEAAVSNMQELADVAGKSNSEALEIINKRAGEAFEEIKAVIDKSKS